MRRDGCITYQGGGDPLPCFFTPVLQLQVKSCRGKELCCSAAGGVILRRDAKQHSSQGSNRDSPDFLTYDNIQPEGLKNNLCTSSSIEKDPVFLLPGVDQRESNLVESQ